MKLVIGTLFAVLGLTWAAPAWSGLLIGSGGSISIGSGSIELGGGDVTIDGQLDVDNGALLGVGDVVINGTMNAGAGQVRLEGDWIRNGTFDTGTASIEFVDTLGDSAQISGDSTFHELSMLSSAGGAFVLQGGSVQRITQQLTIQGVSGFPVQIESSDPALIAQMVLDPAGSQDIAFVGVSNVWATGQPLAPDETNQGGTGNDFGWFGNSLEPLIVPTLSGAGLALLILLLLGVIALRRESLEA